MHKRVNAVSVYGQYTCMDSLDYKIVELKVNLQVSIFSGIDFASVISDAINSPFTFVFEVK